LTLLIVDDEEGPRQSLRIVFKHDYDVLVACNGHEAMDLARRQPVHVAVLDILMEGMSGVELLRELKEITPSIQVVMLTAYETLETARQALRYGASDYLNKPFDIPTMRAAVSKAAEKYKAAYIVQRNDERLHLLQREIDQQRVNEEMARTQGEIYASVLHDLNNPLTVISAFIEVINHSMHSAAIVEGDQLAGIREDLRNLTGQVERCFQISRRYLSFLKTRDAGQPSDTGVRQTLADLRDLLSRHPSAQGHQLIVHDMEQDAAVDINGTDLLQILLNLTTNALQSTEMPHTVDVQATLLTHSVDLHSIVEGNSERFINREEFRNVPPLVAISVSDTGPGIPADILRKMFEEQFTTKPPECGTGLGLSIVKRLLKEARAGIQIQTAVGKGAEFTMYLKAI